MNDGGPAFPIPYEDEGRAMHIGMSMRDWLAGMALQGLLTSEGRPNHPEWVAGIAYGLADAMLAEREKEAGK